MPKPLVLTMGEPAGIGGEIALSAWRRRAEAVPVFALIDDPTRLAALAESLGWPVPIRPIGRLAEAESVWSEALPILPLTLPTAVQAGRPDTRHAGSIIAAIERAVAFVTSGEAAALVTNPIQKSSLAAAGFRYPGHTEFLAALAGIPGDPVMMLASDQLRTVPVTIHMALRQAIGRLSAESIVSAGQITAQALKRDFGIAKPVLAVCGLNPHAGEDGMFGREEIEIIAPAIETLKADGISVVGPVSADTLFHAAARARYDAALCMYHDQALIPVKTLDFERAVNVTLGLPFIRTSPDHGTALGIAGRGEASAESLLAALRLAATMAGHRALS